MHEVLAIWEKPEGEKEKAARPGETWAARRIKKDLAKRPAKNQRSKLLPLSVERISRVKDTYLHDTDVKL